MRKASEYREHAAECRQLAAAMDGEHQRQLLEMADTWEQLAHEREELIARRPELALEDEADGGRAGATGTTPRAP
jgi:hypothetical protein